MGSPSWILLCDASEIEEMVYVCLYICIIPSISILLNFSSLTFFIYVYILFFPVSIDSGDVFFSGHFIFSFLIAVYQMHNLIHSGLLLSWVHCLNVVITWSCSCFWSLMHYLLLFAYINIRSIYCKKKKCGIQREISRFLSFLILFFI